MSHTFSLKPELCTVFMLNPCCARRLYCWWFGVVYLFCWCCSFVFFLYCWCFFVLFFLLLFVCIVFVLLVLFFRIVGVVCIVNVVCFYCWCLSVKVFCCGFDVAGDVEFVVVFIVEVLVLLFVYCFCVVCIIDVFFCLYCWSFCLFVSLWFLCSWGCCGFFGVVC